MAQTKKRKILITLDEARYEALDREARRLGYTKSVLVAMLINERLAAAKSGAGKGEA